MENRINIFGRYVSPATIGVSCVRGISYETEPVYRGGASEHHAAQDFRDE